MKKLFTLAAVMALLIFIGSGAAFAQADATAHAPASLTLNGLFTVAMPGDTIVFGNPALNTIPASGTATYTATAPPATITVLGYNSQWYLKYHIESSLLPTTAGLSNGTDTIPVSMLGNAGGLTGSITADDGTTPVYSHTSSAYTLTTVPNTFLASGGRKRGVMTYNPGANGLSATVYPETIAGVYTGDLWVTLTVTP